MKQPLASASLRAAARYLQQLAGLLACLIPLHGYGAPGATSAPDNMETRVLACTSCHGLRGQGMQGDYFPRLAGRPAGYLYNQLVAFRSGRRNYAPTNYLLEYQSDAYLQAIIPCLACTLYRRGADFLCARAIAVAPAPIRHQGQRRRAIEKSVKRPRGCDLGSFDDCRARAPRNGGLTFKSAARPHPHRSRARPRAAVHTNRPSRRRGSDSMPIRAQPGP